MLMKKGVFYFCNRELILLYLHGILFTKQDNEMLQYSKERRKR